MQLESMYGPFHHFSVTVMICDGRLEWTDAPEPTHGTYLPLSIFLILSSSRNARAPIFCSTRSPAVTNTVRRPPRLSAGRLARPPALSPSFPLATCYTMPPVIRLPPSLRPLPLYDLHATLCSTLDTAPSKTMKTAVALTR